MGATPAADRRPRRTALAGLLRDAARLDRTQSDPAVAARNAFGIAAPLGVGILVGGVALGLAATIGALQTSFADRPGPYRLRILRMLGTAFAAAVTSGLAVLASRSDVASVLLLLVLAFAAGLLLTGGPSATQVGVAGVATALILGHLPQAPSAAMHVALFVLAGGTGEALLAVAGWPLRRHRPERVALAGLYRELAGAARLGRGSQAGPPAGATLSAVRQVLYGLGHDHGPSVEAYRVLLDEAERIRRELVVIVSVAERLARDKDPILAGVVRGSLSAAADILDDVGGALEKGRSVTVDIIERANATLDAAIRRLEQRVDAPAGLTRTAAAARLRALAGQLRAVVESARAGASEGARGAGQPDRGARALRSPLADLRAGLSPDSAVLRHAVRLAVLVAGTDAVVRLANVDRGYWVSLTVLVVLRPDFGATLQRALLRTTGTIVGLLFATELVRLIPSGAWWQVAIIAAFAFGLRLAGPGNVALSAMSLSGLVVVLLEINSVPAHTTVVSRALATLAGGALAVLAAVALPAWERQFVPVRLAALIGAYREFLLAVADPATDRARMQHVRAASRLARTNAQASVDRARSEPVLAQAEVELGGTVLAHTHRFIHAMLAVDVVRVTVREAGGLPELSAFLASAADVLEIAQRAIVTPEPIGPVDSLRPAHDELARAVSAQPERAGGIDTATTLIDATDRVTNSLDTLMSELRRQHGVAP